MKENSIIDNINPSKLKTAKRVCNVLNRCFGIRKKIQHKRYVYREDFI